MSENVTPGPRRSRWHGFRDWVDFGKATLALGMTISGILWGVLTWAFDGRYAPVEVVDSIAVNGRTAKRVDEKLSATLGELYYNRAFDLRVQGCQLAPGAGRQQFEREIGTLVDKYQTETKRAMPDLPDCGGLR